MNGMAGGDQISLQKILMGNTDAHNNPIGNTVFVANVCLVFFCYPIFFVTAT